MLTPFSLPPLYRIHAHALFAAALDDWYEADVCSQPEWRFAISYLHNPANTAYQEEQARAEALFQQARYKWPQGENAKTDELLDNARQVLDNLAADVLADCPDDWQERKADLEDEKQEAAQAEMDAIRNEIANEATWYVIIIMSLHSCADY
jgi:1,4-alpha-glucan branching enzyme